jgi:putative phosphoribosyl transferase
MVMVRFRDRSDAGCRLANLLLETAGSKVVILGLARGGVAVAYEVARRLRAPLDVLVVRKLGVPGEEELAMGAVAPGGTQVLNHELIHLLGVPRTVIDQVSAREQQEVVRRERAYRRGLSPLGLFGREVIVVDDGLATGASMRAAIGSVHTTGAQRITVAVPIGSPETCEELRTHADDVLCLTAPEGFLAVGQYYDDFSPTTDEEVQALLGRAARQRFAAQSMAHR